MKRNDQNNLLDVFLARTSLQTDLDDTSFISSLDMNPDVPSSTLSMNVLQFPGLSRDPSRASTPASGGMVHKHSSFNPIYTNPVTSPEQAESGSRALSDFRRFGQKLGMGLRFSRDAKATDGS